MLHIIWSIIVGFVVGFWLTVGVGVGGSIVGGLIARIFSKPKDGALFHPAGFLLSIIGAIVLLFVIAKLNNHA
jgi:uncharacterized membrane protein YeaQ/YmgE (transglycosylase-associated protein family)